MKVPCLDSRPSHFRDESNPRQAPLTKSGDLSSVQDSMYVRFSSDESTFLATTVQLDYLKFERVQHGGQVKITRIHKCTQVAKVGLSTTVAPVQDPR